MNKKILSIMTFALAGVTVIAADATATSTSTTTTGSTSTSSESTLVAQTKTMDSLATSKGQTNVTNKIASDFTSFAGSTENAQVLVTGLRTGSSITLISAITTGTATTPTTASSVTFTPPTGTMGNGNVFISLALAQQQLTAMGITQPTPEQIQAALVGGTVTTTNGTTTTTQNFKGILQMRASGMGWGQIANSLGVKLGPVIAAIKSGNTYLAAKATKTTSTTGSAAAAGKSAAGSAQGGKSKGSTYYADTHSGIVTASGASAARGYAGSNVGKGNAYGAQHASTSASSGIVTASGGQGGGVATAGDNGKALGHVK